MTNKLDPKRWGGACWLAAVLVLCGDAGSPRAHAQPPAAQPPAAQSPSEAPPVEDAAVEDAAVEDAAVEDAAAVIAGRDLAGWSAEAHSDDRVVRLRAVRSLGLFGAAAGDALGDALDSDDAAVRYLAAVQLGRIGGAPLRSVVRRLQSLRDDRHEPAVQLAAAYALCRAGKSAGNISLLSDRLASPEQGMACSAAELLGMLGSEAAAAVPALRRAIADQESGARDDGPVGAAALQALRKIQADPATPARDDADPAHADAAQGDEHAAQVIDDAAQEGE